MNRNIILPNIITGLNFLFGIFALILIFNEDFIPASICIFISMICDLLDGQVARRNNATSHFGMEFDSLSDLVSFGIAPGMLLFAFHLHELNELGIFIVSVYILSCGIRLARFNVTAKPASKNVFSGLPSPAAAGLVCSSLILVTKYNSVFFLKLLPMTVLTAGILMISSVKYPVPVGFIYFMKNKITGLPRLAVLGLGAVLLFTRTEILLYAIFAIYVTFGITRAVLQYAPNRIPTKASLKLKKSHRSSKNS